MTAPAPRALAPDLARGAMLLAIACAHAPLFVLAVDHGPALANGAALVLHELFVGNHARPMFAFLFGYALAQTLDRRVAGGADPVGVRALLRRRGWWLLAFGLVHTLLVPLDILAAYGVASLLLVGLLRARSTTLLWVAGLALVPGTALSAVPLGLALSQGVSTFDIGSVAPPPGSDPGALYLERLPGTPFALAVGTVLVVPGVVAGMWAARHRLLEEPERNRAFLTRAVMLTTAVSVAGALPSILVQTGAWSAPSAAAQWGTALLQPLTGYFGGVGMAGIVALAAIRAARTRGVLTTAVQALGQRSLTFYLLQSVVFLAVFSPVGLGWQDRLGLAGAFGAAAATWLASLAAAELMRRAGYRGPAENLLRRLTRRAAPRAPRETPSSA
ncbi:DUF418 domain-containing protein [Nocardiopsis dassonvillei]|uniref:DUF418 domain-containing protein n=1 Tax=Nocardiopsis dassonvillei TaxID=2014 RepID=UPI0020A5EC12|nr:DUF418 domain-containing protein [Nocardiopsis dassonvillei]MCP3016865.1 DUF418 domain-containing protein [Nocardiopsis dassonvillei]